MSSKRINYIAIHVAELEKSVHFYRDILGIPLRSDEPSHYEFSWDNPYTHFIIFRLKDGESPSHSEFGFSSQNLDEDNKRLIAERVEVLERPTNQPWGYSAAYLDPDNNIVNLTEFNRVIAKS